MAPGACARPRASAACTQSRWTGDPDRAGVGSALVREILGALIVIVAIGLVLSVEIRYERALGGGS
jgi:hypothetical protein